MTPIAINTFWRVWKSVTALLFASKHPFLLCPPTPCTVFIKVGVLEGVADDSPGAAGHSPAGATQRPHSAPRWPLQPSCHGTLPLVTSPFEAVAHVLVHLPAKLSREHAEGPSGPQM